MNKVSWLPEALEIRSMKYLPAMENGEVWLVGAGPGHIGLMTLLGHHVLNQADVVIHDRLGCQEILPYIHPDTELIDVGKTSGKKYTSQENIISLLAEKAREGKKVVRLKGGDPFVFGRGMEEVVALTASNIPVRVIPGITSGVSAPLAGGIPVTHRETSRSFSISTARDKDGRIPPHGKIDTEIYLMALHRLQDLTEELVNSGLSPELPASVISHASTYRQRVVESTLSGIASKCRSEKIESPAVFVIGETNRERRQDLFLGSPVVVVPSYRIPTRLREAFPKAEVVWRPLWHHKEYIAENRFEDSLKSDGLLFTNPSSVEFWLAGMSRRGIDLRSIKGDIIAVGEETIALLSASHLIPDVSFAEQARSDVLKELSTLYNGRSVTFVGAEGTSSSLRRSLIVETDIELLDLTVYRRQAVKPIDTDWNSVDYLCINSPQTLERSLEFWGIDQLKDKPVLCIGQKLYELIKRKGFSSVRELGTGIQGDSAPEVDTSAEDCLGA